MKKILIPAMFVIALAGSAFTRFSNTSHKSGNIGYYPDYTGFCQEYVFYDDNCTTDSDFAQYICEENVPGYGWAVMLQYYSSGTVCYQPWYAYFPTN